MQQPRTVSKILLKKQTQRVYDVWYHTYEILEQAKVIYSLKEKKNSWYLGGMGEEHGD